MRYVVDQAEGADWGDGADRAEGTDETVWHYAIRMNALFYFDCLGRKEFKNIAYNRLWEPYDVTVAWMGRIIPLRLLLQLEHLRC